MVRRLPILLIAVAALLAVEPVLHQHPLVSTDASATSGATCVVCAAGLSSLAKPSPVVAAPVQIAYTAFTPIATTLANGVGFHLPSRAPPAA